MSITHHPSEATLFAHAAGGLPGALEAVVATHLCFCAACRAAVRVADGAGGALLEALAPAPLAEGALDAVLARLDQAPPAPALAPAPPAGVPWPRPLARLAHGRWRWLGPGMRAMRLGPPAARGGSLAMLRIAPGRAMPVHGHGGLELVCVLAGSFADESGTYRPGDVSEHDEEDRHQPVAGREADCICLSGTDAALRLSGLARLLQPLLGL